MLVLVTLPALQAPGLQLEAYRAALEGDHEDPAEMHRLLASTIECSSSPNVTLDGLDTHELQSHADAEQALRDGDLRAALRHTCSAAANGTAEPNHRTVCLGHSLEASRSPGGRQYARMVVLATRASFVHNAGLAGEHSWGSLLAADIGDSPARRARLIGHVGDGSRSLHSVYRVDSFLAAAECALLVNAAEALGSWTLASHTPYPTADIHLSELATAAEDAAMQHWVGMWIASRVYPMLAELYAVAPGSLWLKEAVLIKYLPAWQPTDNGTASNGTSSGPAAPPLVPAGVAEHRDASVFSFNVLLNDPAEIVGGGTFFPQLLRVAELDGAAGTRATSAGADRAARAQSETVTYNSETSSHTQREEDPRLVKLGRGDIVVHAGKVLHAGLPLEGEDSKRYLLAGFVQLCSPCEE